MNAAYPMIDHMSIGVDDVGRARGFYDATLSMLGYKRLFDHGEAASAYGPELPFMQYWIGRPLDESRPAAAGNGTHVCLTAPSRDAVAAFHAAALAHGGKDAGAPGPRPAYGETYFGASVLDPEGHKVGAVCYAPE